MIKVENMLVPLSHYRKWLIPFQDEKTCEFIRKARLVHGNKYDYRFIKYINNKERICILCLEHGEFWQIPNNHLSGSGCTKCRDEKTRQLLLSTDTEFISKSNILHKNKYDYSKVVYRGNKQKVCIICPEHGEFWQTPNHHLDGEGCPKCGIDTRANKNKKEFNEFVTISNQIHENKYSYSETDFVDNSTKTKIICPEHGEFWQLPVNHLRGQGCPKCGIIKSHSNTTYTNSIFIELANSTHKNKYDYSKVSYINSQTPVCIICPKHGEFWQKPNTHIRGSGCPICASSTNICESYVGEWLSKSNIDNTPRYVVPDLIRNSSNIIIDYRVVLSSIIWIEYNGLQHYEFVDFFHEGNIENFKNQLRRDEKVRNYCSKNNIRLIEIPYIYNTRESIFEFLDNVITKGIDPYTFVNYESLFKRPLDYIPYTENENN